MIPLILAAALQAGTVNVFDESNGEKIIAEGCSEFAMALYNESQSLVFVDCLAATVSYGSTEVTPPGVVHDVEMHVFFPGDINEHVFPRCSLSLVLLYSQPAPFTIQASCESLSFSDGFEGP